MKTKQLCTALFMGLLLLGSMGMVLGEEKKEFCAGITPDSPVQDILGCYGDYYTQSYNNADTLSGHAAVKLQSTFNRRYEGVMITTSDPSKSEFAKLTSNLFMAGRSAGETVCVQDIKSCSTFSTSTTYAITMGVDGEPATAIKVRRICDGEVLKKKEASTSPTGGAGSPPSAGADSKEGGVPKEETPPKTKTKQFFTSGGLYVSLGEKGNAKQAYEKMIANLGDQAPYNRCYKQHNLIKKGAEHTILKTFEVSGENNGVITVTAELATAIKDDLSLEMTFSNLAGDKFFDYIDKSRSTGTSGLNHLDSYRVKTAQLTTEGVKYSWTFYINESKRPLSEMNFNVVTKMYAKTSLVDSTETSTKFVTIKGKGGAGAATTSPAVNLALSGVAATAMGATSGAQTQTTRKEGVIVNIFDTSTGAKQELSISDESNFTITVSGGDFGTGSIDAGYVSGGLTFNSNGIFNSKNEDTSRAQTTRRGLTPGTSYIFTLNIKDPNYEIVGSNMRTGVVYTTDHTSFVEFAVNKKGATPAKKEEKKGGDGPAPGDGPSVGRKTLLMSITPTDGGTVTGYGYQDKEKVFGKPIPSTLIIGSEVWNKDWKTNPLNTKKTLTAPLKQYPVTLEKGKTYKFQAKGGTGIEVCTVTLRNSAGQVVDKDKTYGPKQDCQGKWSDGFTFTVTDDDYQFDAIGYETKDQSWPDKAGILPSFKVYLKTKQGSGKGAGDDGTTVTAPAVELTITAVSQGALIAGQQTYAFGSIGNLDERSTGVYSFQSGTFSFTVQGFKGVTYCSVDLCDTSNQCFQAQESACASPFTFTYSLPAKIYEITINGLDQANGNRLVAYKVELDQNSKLNPSSGPLPIPVTGSSKITFKKTPAGSSQGTGDIPVKPQGTATAPGRVDVECTYTAGKKHQGTGEIPALPSGATKAPITVNLLDGTEGPMDCGTGPVRPSSQPSGSSIPPDIAQILSKSKGDLTLADCEKLLAYTKVSEPNRATLKSDNALFKQYLTETARLVDCYDMFVVKTRVQ